MKIKVGDTVYTSENQPIMIILTKKDKENIKNMPEDNYRYCEFIRENYSDEEIRKWMDKI